MHVLQLNNATKIVHDNFNGVWGSTSGIALLGLKPPLFVSTNEVLMIVILLCFGSRKIEHLIYPTPNTPSFPWGQLLWARQLWKWLLLGHKVVPYPCLGGGEVYQVILWSDTKHFRGQSNHSEWILQEQESWQFLPRYCWFVLKEQVMVKG